MGRIALGSGVLAALLFAGCGGGGGGGGSSFAVVDGGSAYSGARTTASLDAECAQDFGGVTTTGIEFGEGISETVMPSGTSLGRASAVGRIVLQPAAEAAAQLRRSGARALARSETETQYGDCGGSVTRTTNVPDTLQFPLTMSGSARFEGFCDQGTTVDGVVRFIASVDAQFSISMTEAFSELAVIQVDEQDPENSENLVLTGTISGTISGAMDQLTDAVMTVNLNVEDLTTSTMVWFQYTVDILIDSFDDREVVDIDGSVYHSEHGRVSVTTRATGSLASGYTFPVGAVASLVIDGATDTPLSGGILIEGVAGNAAIIDVVSVQDGGPLDGYEVVLDDMAPVGTFDGADSVFGPHAWE